MKKLLVEQLKPLLLWVERLLLVALLVGLFLYGSDMKVEGLITVSLMGLAIIFFLYGYLPLPLPTAEKQQNFLDLLGGTIAPKVLCISSSVLCTGIAFFFLGTTGFREMLLIGTVAAGGAIGIILLTSSQRPDNLKVLSPYLYRAIPLAAAGAYLVWQ